jgi:hypothetical protein
MYLFVNLCNLEGPFEIQCVFYQGETVKAAKTKHQYLENKVKYYYGGAFIIIDRLPVHE